MTVTDLAKRADGKLEDLGPWGRFVVAGGVVTVFNNQGFPRWVNVVFALVLYGWVVQAVLWQRNERKSLDGVGG